MSREKNEAGRGNDEIGGVLRKLERDELVELLSTGKSGSELNTLLLEVFRERSASRSPGELLRSYKENRFVKPAAVDPIALKQLELELLRIAQSHKYTPIQLSPVAPLGSCSVVAPADQNKIISALRGTEVVADVTNVIALHIADGVKSGDLQNHSDPVRFSSTHRHVRAQKFPNLPGMLAHFSLYAMVTSGKDIGSYGFEKQAIWEHIAVYRQIFRSQYQAEIEIIINARGGYTDSEGLLERIIRHIGEQAPDLTVKVNAASSENAYYKGLQFTIKTTIGGREYNIGDGGFVDWTQQLLENKKERMLISAIGLDRLLMP
ncbi:hypothetical protein N0M98_19120 [Paenibacillus doosanensis]|uniref:hypothetical protein n=1 Tax=Paenibacillus doosanensis TaxID=1229154 RepID=UPI00217F7772|nr:hypothetical protein [Paenibacillus doosanensis]MCS7462256.1 hypothetical protein [Paenibacillus doosanensis]